MLARLHIENIAVIEQADIAFAPGFNVLTGETGAGKSIVIDAIGAVTGARASRDLIRTGAKSAVAEAVFSSLDRAAWSGAAGVEPDEEGTLILRREISADGKNLCHAGGRSLTVSQLRAVGQRLLNIHGQHDGQLLLDEGYHLEYLDRFGGHAASLASYREAYERYLTAGREMAALQMDEAEKLRRTETLQYQIEELERARLVEGEDDALAARKTLLGNAGKLMAHVDRAYAALLGEEDAPGAAALLSEAAGALRAAARIGVGGVFDTPLDLAEQLCSLTEDAAEELREIRDTLSFSPEELDAVEGRLDLLYRLRKKYGGSVSEMLSYLEACREELEQITCAEDTLLRLEEKRRAALAEARTRAEALSEARRAAAEALTARVCEELSGLDMGGVRFTVEFEEPEGEEGLDPSGMDQVCFLMSANAGEAMKSISRVASGGELARIMLALKNVLAETDEVGTLIFDEVDTGVSGRAARRVAEKLYCVARGKQVLCVTHLPQIAAMADVHFSVEKAESGGRTYTRVAVLDRARRRAELARITGGVTATETMLQGAEEMLSSAELYKKSRPAACAAARSPSTGGAGRKAAGSRIGKGKEA